MSLFFPVFQNTRILEFVFFYNQDGLLASEHDACFQIPRHDHTSSTRSGYGTLLLWDCLLSSFDGIWTRSFCSAGSSSIQHADTWVGFKFFLTQQKQSFHCYTFIMVMSGVSVLSFFHVLRIRGFATPSVPSAAKPYVTLSRNDYMLLVIVDCCGMVITLHWG